jgi:hypothetical protein
MEYGIKISKPTKDVLTCGVKDLLIDTSYPLLKVKATGTGTLSAPNNGGDTDTITHNLGYIPRVLVYGQVHELGVGKSAYYRKYPYIRQQVGIYSSNFSYDITTTELKIYGSFGDEGFGTETFDYFYYLFYDEK